MHLLLTELYINHSFYLKLFPEIYLSMYRELNDAPLLDGKYLPKNRGLPQCLTVGISRLFYLKTITLCINTCSHTQHTACDRSLSVY